MTTPKAGALVALLTLDEKAALTAGKDLWSTVGVPAHGIPSVGLTDGPNGARGRGLPGIGTDSSSCTPCGSALGATWDVGLVEQIGALIGREARAKGCHVLLAPTVNIHRSPLGGRTFESFSEDPFLSGRLAAAYIQGAQSAGVATAVKHFAGNEAERERMTADSLIDERALREIYLLPFELAVREGGSLSLMTAYNRLNGSWCSEHAELLRILRQEWKFDGFVVTDWFAGAHTVAAAEAGLDLEMPGPGRAFGPAIAEAVRAGQLAESTLDLIAARQLSVYERVGALDASGEVPAVDTEQDRALLRSAAAEAMVLLRNEGSLPLALETLGSIAVIGPHAARPQIAGGGSAQVRPHHRTSPIDALRERVPPMTQVRYARGLDINTSLPLLDGARLRTADGSPGLAVEWFAGANQQGAPIARTSVSESSFGFTDPPVAGSEDGWSLRASGRFTPLESGPHLWTLSQAGVARLLVDGQVLIDGAIDPPPAPGIHFFGLGSIDLTATIELTEAREYEVVIELTSPPGALIGGVRVGCRPAVESGLIERAVAAAAESDVAIVFAGTSDEWESEGRDREFLGLPGEQDELIHRVAAVNPKTIVVVNAGAPVAMPWAQDVSAIVHVWFGGQEMSEAVVDVLTGEVDPGGRLPTTFPLRIEDTPAFGSFRPENHVVRYAEGIFVGYRWYDARRIPTLFPFGHGLSYGDIAVGTPTESATTFHSGESLVVDVPVENVGTCPGTVVVQGYVVPADAPVVRPPQELKAFDKVRLDPGQLWSLQLTFDDRSFSYWHSGDGHAITGEAVNALSAIPGMAAGIGELSGTPAGWVMVPGDYDIVVARSSAEPLHRVRIHVAG